MTTKDKLQKVIEMKRMIVDDLNYKTGGNLDINATREEIQFALALLKENEIVNRTITDYTNNKITDIGMCAFYGCGRLTMVQFDNALTVGNSAFRDCGMLTNVIIPSVTTIAPYGFYNCYRMTSIKLPSVTSIDSNAFTVCVALTDIYLGSDQVVELKNISAFNNGASNTVLHVKSGVEDQYQTTTNWDTLIANGRITIVGDYED